MLIILVVFFIIGVVIKEANKISRVSEIAFPLFFSASLTAIVIFAFPSKYTTVEVVSETKPLQQYTIGDKSLYIEIKDNIIYYRVDDTFKNISLGSVEVKPTTDGIPQIEYTHEIAEKIPSFWFTCNIFHDDTTTKNHKTILYYDLK